MTCATLVTQPPPPTLLRESCKIRGYQHLQPMAAQLGRSGSAEGNWHPVSARRWETGKAVLMWVCVFVFVCVPMRLCACACLCARQSGCLRAVWRHPCARGPMAFLTMVVARPEAFGK